MRRVVRGTIMLIVVGISVVALPALAVAVDCPQQTKSLRLLQKTRYQLVLDFVDNEVHTYFKTDRRDVLANGKPNPSIVYELNDLLIPEAENTLRIMGYNEGLVGKHDNPGRIIYSIIRGGDKTKVVLRSQCDHPDNQSPVRRDMFDHTYTVTFN
jgi:hypothetical protein